MPQTLFHMWERFRQSLIDAHKFYLEQAQKRLLSQFETIDKETEEYSNNWLNEVSSHFDPEHHDPSDFYEQAREEGIEHGLMLLHMRERTRLSVVAGLFHEWDKQLRSWLVKEISRWHTGDEVKKAVWNANFGQISDLLEQLGWKLSGQPYHTILNKYRLLVNAYKHGDGTSFQDVKTKYPEFLHDIMRSPEYIALSSYDDLTVEDHHISELSEAIIKFWKEVPEYIVNGDDVNVPEWFYKALEKDNLAKKKIAETT